MQHKWRKIVLKKLFKKYNLKSTSNHNNTNNIYIFLDYSDLVSSISNNSDAYSLHQNYFNILFQYQYSN